MYCWARTRLETTRVSRATMADTETPMATVTVSSEAPVTATIEHRQQEQGEGDEDVHGRRHRVIQPAAREGRRQSHGHADGGAHHDGPEAHHQRDTGAHHDLAEEVPAQPVRAEEVGETRALQAAATRVAGVER